MSCNNTLFNELIDFLLTELGKNTNTSTTRTYIQCVGAIRYASLGLMLRMRNRKINFLISQPNIWGGLVGTQKNRLN